MSKIIILFFASLLLFGCGEAEQIEPEELEVEIFYEHGNYTGEALREQYGKVEAVKARLPDHLLDDLPNVSYSEYGLGVPLGSDASYSQTNDLVTVKQIAEEPTIAHEIMHHYTIGLEDFPKCNDYVSGYAIPYNSETSKYPWRDGEQDYWEDMAETATFYLYFGESFRDLATKGLQHGSECYAEKYRFMYDIFEEEYDGESEFTFNVGIPD